MSSQQSRVRDLPEHSLVELFRENNVAVDYGAAVVRIRSASRRFVSDFRRVYGAFPIDTFFPFSDFHTELANGTGLRAIVRPQCRFLIDGIQPFDPFAETHALPHFEWGVNWCFAQRFNQYVLMHSGSLAVGDQGVIMAAPPGSGKSTLTAAMMLRGFRLLSDEFGVLCPESGQLWPMLKPVALKNQSIDVIRAFAHGAVIGPVFEGTRKGDVAHLAPNQASVDARGQTASPALVIFPKYQNGSELQLVRLPAQDAFAQLAFNSFNYSLLGDVGFNAIADITERCPAYELRYSDLDAAIERIHTLLADLGTS